jgi:hypothetical protein
VPFDPVEPTMSLHLTCTVAGQVHVGWPGACRLARTYMNQHASTSHLARLQPSCKVLAGWPAGLCCKSTECIQYAIRTVLSGACMRPGEFMLTLLGACIRTGTCLPALLVCYGRGWVHDGVLGWPAWLAMATTNADWPGPCMLTMCTHEREVRCHRVPCKGAVLNYRVCTQ